MTPDELLATVPETLEYTGEFGTEIVCFLPFVHWMHEHGHLANRRVRTYSGMRPFYWFVDADRYEEKRARRAYIRRGKRPQWLPNLGEMSAVKSPYESFPDYRAAYAGKLPLRFDKPLLVVNNKYAHEWNVGPVNFLPLDLLDHIFATFRHEYQIVYFREGFGGVRLTERGFSPDHNVPQFFDDAALIDRYPNVLSFERMMAHTDDRLSYNDMKLRLLAACHHFISVQGGGSYPLALLPGSLLLILHIMGYETTHPYTHGFFQYAATPPPLLMVARNAKRLRSALPVFANPKIIEGQAVVPDPLLVERHRPVLEPRPSRQ